MKTHGINVTSGNLLNGGYPFTQYDLGDTSGGMDLSRIKMRTDDVKTVLSIYPDLVNRFSSLVGGEYVVVPYCFVEQSGNRVWGDYTKRGGVEEFYDTGVSVVAEPFHPDPENRDLWRLSQLLQDWKFDTMDPIMAVRGMNVADSALEFKVGLGLYSDAAFSVNSDGLPLSLDRGRKSLLKKILSPESFKEMLRLLGKFSKKYGGGLTVREIIKKKYGSLPPFEKAYSYIMGGAGIILTEDGYVVLVLRSPKTTVVNHGINVPTSGGVNFDEGKLDSLGLPLYLMSEMLREAKEELGVSGKLLRLHPMAFVRELTRGGTPDVLYLLEYRGSIEDIVKTIAKNRHPSRREIDRMVFAFRLADVRRLVHDPHSIEVVHHKALVSLIMLDRFMRAHND